MESGHANLSTVERLRERAQRSALSRPRLAARHVSIVLSIEPDLKRRAHLGERGATGYGHQVLPSNVTAASLDAALVVAFAGATEPRLEGVVRGERGEARAARR